MSTPAESTSTMAQGSYVADPAGGYAVKTSAVAGGAALPTIQQSSSVSDAAVVTAPTPGQVIATIASQPAGTYEVEVNAFIGGTTVAANEINNMRLVVGGVAFSRIINPVPGTTGATDMSKAKFRATLATPGTFQVIAVLAGTAGSVYAAQIAVTRMA